tara:strand:+ start:2340 stop:2648 length:309 start_codon:yes stop_codon:yes gene_type:complete
MTNKKKHIIKYLSNFFMKSLGMFFFLIFINFTFAIQYVNWSDFNMTLTEIIEEEEKEEHRNDLLDVLVNNIVIISLIDFDINDVPLLCRYQSDVLTPPPELS